MSEKKQKKQIVPNDFMQWIGGSYYSVESFIKEAQKMGASRRINFMPNNVVVGVSKVFLISDMATEVDRQKYKDEVNRRFREAYRVTKDDPSQKYSTSQKEYGKLPRGTAVVFGYFTINDIIYVTGPGIDVPERLKELGVTEYKYLEGGFGFQDERGCGSLAVGGTYFISEEDMEKVKDLSSSAELQSKNVHIFKTPIPLPEGINRFRGILVVPDNIKEDLNVEVASHDLEQVKKFKKEKKGTK